MILSLNTLACLIRYRAIFVSSAACLGLVLIAPGRSADAVVIYSQDFELPDVGTAIASGGPDSGISLPSGPPAWFYTGNGNFRGIVDETYVLGGTIIAQPQATSGDQLAFVNSTNSGSGTGSLFVTAINAGDLSNYTTLNLQVDVGNTNLVNNGGDPSNTVTVGLWSPVTSSFVASNSFLLNTIAEATSLNKSVNLEISSLTAPQLAGALQVRLQVSSTTATLSQLTFDTVLVQTVEIVETVPEPSTYALGLIGLAGLGLLAWRRKRRIADC